MTIQHHNQPLSTKMWADALVERVEEAKAAIEEWIDFLEN
jgi:hypothetical protein